MNVSVKKQSLIALLGIMTSGMVLAADAIDVKNVADPVRHPYQQTALANCVTPNPNGCVVVFPAITTSRTLVLHASCYTVLSDPVIVTEVYLSDITFKVKSYMSFTKIADADDDSYVVVSGDPYMFFETGQQPMIYFDAHGNNNTNVECTLGGYYL
jgi:hypothetical protein